MYRVSCIYRVLYISCIVYIVYRQIVGVKFEDGMEVRTGGRKKKGEASSLGKKKGQKAIFPRCEQAGIIYAKTTSIVSRCDGAKCPDYRGLRHDVILQATV